SRFFSLDSGRWNGSDFVHRLGVGADALTRLERRDRPNLVVVQRERPDVEVTGDARRGDRLGDDGIAELQVPAQYGLRGCDAMTTGDFREQRIFDKTAAGERTPRLRR